MGDLFAFSPIAEPVETKHDAQPPDWFERAQALDVTRSWIVEAPAGSGKTGLLIQRYLKLLALPSVEQPEQVLAITFTLKATGEIRERVLVELERVSHSEDRKNDFSRETRALAQAVLQRDRAQGWDLLNHPRRLNIRTIDSISAEIARGLPVLSGGSGLSPVDDATQLYRLAAERTLMQLGGSDADLSRALRLLLLHRDGNLSQLRELISEMLALRDQWGRLVPLGRQMLEESYLDGTVLPQIERTLEEVICAELTRFAGSIPVDILQDLSILAGEIGHNAGYRGKPSPIAVCAGIYESPSEEAGHLKRWQALIHLLVNKKPDWRTGYSDNYLGVVTDRQQKTRLASIVDRLRGREDLLVAFKRVNALPPAIYPLEQWLVAKALFRVLYRALAELQVVFAERGECDFTEPGLMARTSLRRDGAAFDTALGTHLQHLLVDEMQDTSTSQYELIQLLTQGWDGRSQTVFLVGDPKQSIYLFRQARVERFIRTMRRQRLGELELGCLRLTANFRSQRDLVLSFNQDFSLLFPREVDEDHPDEAPYTGAEPVRGSSPDAHAVVWHPQVLPTGLSPDDKRLIKRRQSRIEASQVRRIIEEWRSRSRPGSPDDPWKIAVLVRNRKHLADIVAELKRDEGSGAIPFRAVNIESLSERQEILDLLALTRALLHPADRVAWLAILRAPWCGLERAELHMLTGADDPALSEHTLEQLLERRGHELCEESCARLERLWTVLRAAAAQHSRLSVGEWVERTWRSIAGDVYLTPEEKANARRYFELLDTLEHEAGAINLEQLKRRMGELYAESPASPGAIDLITIHGSKGLEWDVVLVPGLEKKARTSRGRLLTWNEMPSQDEDAAQVLLAPIAGRGRDSEALNVWLQQVQRAREQAECRRLFYVASTRAREELHLFATPAERTDGSLSIAPDSLLQAAWPAAERHFVNTQVSSKPLIAPVVPLRPSAPEHVVLPGLAAEGEKVSAATLRRLPKDFRPHERFRRVFPIAPNAGGLAPSGASFQRPEGSFEARAVGGAVHALLEILAVRIAAGTDLTVLAAEISSWGPRISAILRSSGLSPHAVERHLSRVRAAVEMALKDPHGLWILSAHKDAASEHALTSWQEIRSNIRMDRIFRAGPEPFAPGEDYLWIVDFKTAQHTGTGLEDFLLKEREKYLPQMQAYARMIHGTPGANIRLGLYYPSLPRFIWWAPEED
jgi:ATP-dependent exoDNAse (exonuclease V) beta subunit